MQIKKEIKENLEKEISQKCCHSCLLMTNQGDQSMYTEDETRPYTQHPKSRGLGWGSNVVGRGIGECRIHDSSCHVPLGRSSDAKTARKTPKKQRRDSPSLRQTDGPTK